MAIVRIQQIVSTGAAMPINFGFVPDKIEVVNLTVMASGAGVGTSSWYKSMRNGAAIIQTLTAGAPVYSLIGSNGYTPFQSSDSNLWIETVRPISGLSNAAQMVVTSTAHGFTAQDVGVTTVTFSGVIGMSQVNTLRGVIQSIVDANNFTVNINSSSFSTYVSGGQANVITGIPPFTQSGFQVFNTPQKNMGFIGLVFGTGVVGTAADILEVTAFVDADYTSA